MKATVKADVRTGRVYNVPFATVREARIYCTKAHAPYRGVLVTERYVECYQNGELVSREDLGNTLRIDNGTLDLESIRDDQAPRDFEIFDTDWEERS